MSALQKLKATSDAFNKSFFFQDTHGQNNPFDNPIFDPKTFRILFFLYVLVLDSPLRTVDDKHFLRHFKNKAKALAHTSKVF